MAWFLRTLSFVCADHDDRKRRICSGVDNVRLLRVAIVFCAICASSARAQGDDHVLTFSEARQLALKQNADLASARAQVLAALAEVRRAKAWANPVLTASIAHIATDGSGNSAARGNRIFDRSYDSIFSLSELIETGGKRALRSYSANTGVKSARAQLDDISRQLVEAVDRAYIAAVEAKQEAQTIAETARSLRKEATIAGQRLEAGDISLVAKSQLEIAAGQRELDAGSAESTAISAVITLQILLGDKTPNGKLLLTAKLAELLPNMENVESLQVLGVRPDLAAAEFDLQKSDIDLREQKRERIPDVTLGVQYERNPPDLNNTFGLSFSVPLPVFDHNPAGIESARAAREQAEARLDKIRVQAAADVSADRIALNEAHTRARRYEQDLAPKSAEVLKTIELSYRRGGSSLLELLEAERDNHDIRISMLRAEADYAEAAESLMSALNRLGTWSH